MSQPPILVTGAPRSGTTWVGQMLALAPGVGYIHEPFNPLSDPGTSGRAFDHFLTYVTEDNGSQFEDALRRSFSFGYDWAGQLPTVRTPRDVARTVRDATSFRLWRHRHARLLVKDPIAVLSAPWLAARFDMDVVVVVRRPQAFVASFKRLGWHHDFAAMLADRRLMTGRLAPLEPEIRALAAAPGDVVDEATLLWLLIYTVVDQYRAEQPAWHYVRHEDLSADPVAGFRRLYSATGLRFTTEVSAAIAAHSSSENPSKQMRAHDTRLDSKASLQGWRTVLTPEEQERVRVATGELAARFYPH